ncbi:hypothetical protein [Novosphingobium sp. KACC 22771]|uniref:hypothetical protein n=1 Tax=Novosphingobium sp. KACC 22771 TaxID=3025670 RepID=UPI002365E28E|nr:hypothetical protein [Novosphingobium sp. KACC 22771]WDF74550.1 hypothetical protein PQ467_21675 [Novosphingobium sp. KACC 22771]
MNYSKILLAATFVAAAPNVAYAQNAPESSQTTSESAAAEAAGQPVSPNIGDTIYDKIGEQLGTISEENDKNVIVATTQGKVTIPIASLAPGDKGLMINMTRDEFHAAIQAARGGQTAR